MKILFFLLLVCCNVLLSRNLTFNEFRVKYNYKKGNYQRSFIISKNKLRNSYTEPVISYCYATSLFKIQEQNLKSNILDKVLHYLKIAKLKNDEAVEELSINDSLLLEEIKDKAIQFSEEEIKKFPSKSVKRLETIIAIYGDTAEIYRIYKIEEKKFKKSKMVSDSILKSTIKTENNDKLIYSVQKVNTIVLLDTLEKICETKLNKNQKEILSTAFKFDCLERYPKGKNNPQILQFFHELGYKNIKDDETSWCAAFLNYCLKKSGHNYMNSLIAKDWLKYGVETKNPQPGDVIVFWREKRSGWKGHVAFFIKEDKTNGLIYAYGGNQEGRVCLKKFPKNQVVSYRRIN